MDVFVVDDHRLTREGLRSLIEHDSSLNLVGEASNGRDALRQVAKLKPDVVVMDLAMPDLNGIEATRQIHRDYPDIRILGLSMHADREYVRQVLEAGASGYVVKDSAFDELEKAVRTIMRGSIYLSPQVADIVVDEYLHQSQQNEPNIYSQLSAREREILQLIAEGYTTKEIAAKLIVSVKTVETHRRNIMETLNLHSVAELTKYAVRSGLTSLDN